MKTIPNGLWGAAALALAGALCASGGASAQTASQQGAGTTCPDGSTPASGTACPSTATASAATLQDAAPVSPADRLPQDGAAAGDDVVVTGSRIARRGTESASPIEVIDSKQLDARGFQTVAQALNELPTFGVPGASPIGFGQSGFGAGQSFVDFLGLGSQRTLVLVNGRRFVSGNTASIFGPTGSGGSQVDLNTIPTKLIDRIETVAAIGAPIYGSDAIAGTINLILKKDYQGLDVDLQNGLSTRGDVPDHRIRALLGKNFAGGRGNITIAGEYDESKGLLFTDRGITALDGRFAQSRNGTGPQTIYTDNRVPSVDPSGVISVGGGAYGLDFPLSPQQGNLVFGDPTQNFGVVNAAGQQLRFGRDGSLVPIDFGTPTGPDGGFSVFTQGGNGYSLRGVENLITDLKRWNAVANASFELTSKIRLFGEAWYSVSQGRNLASQPVYNSGLFGAPGDPDGSIIVPLSNPFLSAAARAAITNAINANPNSDKNLLGTATQDYFYLGRASTDLSSGVSVGRAQVLRFVGGADGTVNVLPGRDWRFEGYLDYGQALTRSRNPVLNEQNFLNAVNATTNAAGQIVCAPGYTNSPVPTISSTCAPLNLFGQQTSQAARDYVTSIATPRSVNNQYDGVASLSGPFFRLPGGNFAFALGFEHRAEDSTFDPGVFYYGAGTGDSSQRTRYGRDVPIDRVHGAFHTNEIFGELNADIISPSNHIPLVYQLTLQSAGRYIWNSQAGADPTYTFQARYAPIKAIAFRGAYTRAVRAPSITEAFNPTSSAYGFATDVCDQTLANQGPAPATRAKNCAAAGVPANFTSLSNQRSFLTYVFGNAALTNEKADSYTAGAVLTPPFLPGLNITADYINIRLKNAISLFTNDQVVEACYDAANYPSNPFCGLVSRDASHQLSNVGTSYFNSANVRYKGVVLSGDYRHATPFLGAQSSMGLNVSYQYLDTRTDEVTAGSVPLQYDNSIGYSRHKGIATVTYANGPFNAQVQVNHIGPARLNPNETSNFYSVPVIGAFNYVNLSVAFNVNERFTIRGDVDNLLDAGAPYPYPATGDFATGATSVYSQGILGRYIRIGAAVHF